MNHPEPEDQYSVDEVSVQTESVACGNTPGADWCYFGVFNNTETGLSPLQAQGASYRLADSVPNPDQSVLQITGYGVADGELYATQQTDTGMYESLADTFGFGLVMGYGVHSKGGTSGSAVQHQCRDLVYGIHTHWGCNSNFDFRNFGTPIDYAPLQNALANPLGVSAAPQDCNDNGIDDGCDLDCGSPGGPCDVPGCGLSGDCSSNGIPDECEPDCNGNGVGDRCDINAGTSLDLNNDYIPDECQPLFVDQSAIGANDGSSWANAYTDLQSALNDPDPCGVGIDEIWVAEGIYTPAVCATACDAASPERGESFQLPGGAILYGGFPAGGGVGTFQARSPASYPTILSGDLNGDDGPGFTNNDENSLAVVRTAFSDSGLDGFHVVGGNANGTGGDAVGAGIWLNGDSTLFNCIVRGNSASNLGAGALANSGNHTIVNCLFTGNVSTNSGAALFSSFATSLTIRNCTFSGNSTSPGGSDNGAGIAYSGAVPAVRNCVLWGNDANGATGESAQIYPVGAGNPSIEFSCVQGWTGAFGGTGNIGSDPLFMDADGSDGFLGTADDNVRLAQGSPAIDAGKNYPGVPETTDLDGNARRVDDPLTDDTGSGTAPLVDMGAYEYFADCNGNGIPDIFDIAPGGGSSDVNSNGIPDECEAGAPLPARYPYDRRTNRYLSFDTNKAENDGKNIAFRIELKSINLGSCNDTTGGNVDFCRFDRGVADCNACSGSGSSCVSASYDCPPGESCDPTGGTCVNNAPNSGGSNVGLVRWVSTPIDPSCFDFLEGHPLGICGGGAPVAGYCVLDQDCPPMCEVSGVHSCQVDGDCEVYEECVLGTCRGTTCCSSADNCTEVGTGGTPCVLGTCQFPRCSLDQDCPPSEQCVLDPVCSYPFPSPCLDEHHVSRAVECPSYVSSNWRSTLHVADCEIVPQAVYGVRAVNMDTGLVSDELLLETTEFAPAGPPAPFWWGDCVGPKKQVCNGDIRGKCNGTGVLCQRDDECSGQECITGRCGGTGAECLFDDECTLPDLCEYSNGCTLDADCTVPDTCQEAWTLPDGVVNGDDVNAVLAAMAQGPGNVLPPTTSVDLVGIGGGGNPPEYSVNFSDVYYVMRAKEGRPYPFYDPADCPGEEGFNAPPPPPPSPDFLLVASKELLDPTEAVQIDVYVTEAVDVFAAEFALEETGGFAGALTVSDITVDTQREDYLFFGVLDPSPYEARDLAGKRYGSSLPAFGPGVTKIGQTYLATFTFQPTPGATGEFQITVAPEPQTFLLNPDGSRQPVFTSATVVVGFGVECLNDAHCDDGNLCTVDTCDEVKSCENDGTGITIDCDDNNACTADDVCQGDATGTCVGTLMDTDSDGLCDADDPDDDNDGVPDAVDPAPLDPDVCGDTDSDTCDDCAVGTDDFGPLSDSDPLNDGPDADGDGICDAETPLVAPYPHDRTKNRYISFDPNKAENDGKNVAFKVELTAITLGSCNGPAGDPAQIDFCRVGRVPNDCNTCAGATAENACIDQPIDCSTGGTCTPTGEICVNDAPNSGGSNVGRVWWVGPEQNGIHLLVSQPFRMASQNWGQEFDPIGHPGEFVVHVGDCEIVPQAVYGVRAANIDTGAESDELLIETTLLATGTSPWWGDVVGSLVRHCGGDIRNPVCATDGDCTAPATCDAAWTLPNGAVNFDDVNAALALVAPGPASVAPDRTWVDLHGNGSGTTRSQAFDPPNLVLNFSDIGQIISGFGGFPYKGHDPADCPDTAAWPDPSGRPAPPPDAPQFTAVASAELLDPTEDVTIDVFVDQVVNVSTYEFRLDVTGGTGGGLTVTAMTVDHGRADYIFFEEPEASILEALNPAAGRMGAMLTTPGASVTRTGPAYLGTLTYQPVEGATGEFEIAIQTGVGSFLLNPDGSTQPTAADEVTVVGFGVDCLTADHCDDNNECTIDTCVANTCQYTPVSAGVACNDGLWCTHGGSTCDGNGLCTGGNPRCQPGELCLEASQQCLPDLPPAPE